MQALTRRELMAMTAAATLPVAGSRLVVPVHRVFDSRPHFSAGKLRSFENKIWSEAVRDFARGGIDLRVTDGPGEVKRSPGDQPIFVGLLRGVLNVVVTDVVPMKWDSARSLAGVTTIYQGFHISLIAMRYAHGDQVPFLSVNTCVHEMLHALLQDVYLKSPKLYQSGGREFRVDGHATRMWLFHDGAAVRQSAKAYLARLAKS